MKQVLVICAAMLALVSCEKKGNGRLDPNAMLSIRPAAGVPIKSAAEANPAHLTALEIVKQAGEMVATPAGRRGFGDYQRDTVDVKLLMFSSDVVGQFGELVTGWIESRDFIIVSHNRDGSFKDTIAYLPNAVVIKAEQEIVAAYAAEEYEACYTLFDQAFRFTPITGAEWRELKAKDEN